MIRKAKHVQTSSGEEQHLECDLISENEGVMVTGLQIKLPDRLVDDNRNLLHRGEWYVRIVGARIEETIIPEYGPLRTSECVPDLADIVTIPPEEGDGYMNAIQGVRTSRYLTNDRRRATK